jgi:2-oxoglutarate ferredoxin oxidoreductase subunit alpha
VRRAKIDGIAKDIPDQDVIRGEDNGDIAVVGWGSTFGPISRAVQKVQNNGHRVSHIHMRHIWPMPGNLEGLLQNFKTVLIPEMNTGQLITVIRDKFLIDAKGLNKVSGKPFKVSEVEEAIREYLEK